MSRKTPRFCSALQESHFSVESASPVAKKHISPTKLIAENDYEKKYKYKNHHHEFIHRHKLRKSINSQNCNSRNYHIDNIYEFIKNHKFKLRNDFDKKNSEKFLLSKEEAFEKPFSFLKESN